MCCSGAEKTPFATGGGPAHLVAATIFSTTTSPAVAGGFDSESSHFAVPQNPMDGLGQESVEVVEAPKIEDKLVLQVRTFLTAVIKLEIFEGMKQCKCDMVNLKDFPSSCA